MSRRSFLRDYEEIGCLFRCLCAGCGHRFVHDPDGREGSRVTRHRIKTQPVFFRQAVFSIRAKPASVQQINQRYQQADAEKNQAEGHGAGHLAAVTGEAAVTIEDVYEPYLMQLGFINRTPRGRVVLPAAYEHLGLEHQMTF